jgi:hypothetical protein
MRAEPHITAEDQFQACPKAMPVNNGQGRSDETLQPGMNILDFSYELKEVQLL